MRSECVAPSIVDANFLDTLYPLQGSAPYFVIPSVFSFSSWCRHKLTLDKVLLP